MKNCKKLTCIFLALILLLNCCPRAFAEGRETVTLFCVSTEAPQGLPVTLMLEDGIVYIQEDSLARLSGFACEGGGRFRCENRSLSLDECRLGGEPWYAAEPAFALLGVRTHAVENSLFFETAGAARARAVSMAERVMVTDNHRYQIQESIMSGTVGVLFAMAYDALSGDLISMLDGRYQSDHVREVLVDIVTVDESRAERLANDFSAEAEALTSWSRLLSNLEWESLPNDLKVLAAFEGKIDPVAVFSRSSGAELKGFGIDNQLKILQYLQSLSFVSEQQYDCLRYLLEDRADIVDAALQELPDDCSSLIDQMWDQLRSYRSAKTGNLIVELLEEELDTITKMTLEVGIENIIETLTGTKLAADAAKFARAVLDYWLPAGKQMDLTLKMFILVRIQRVAFALYCACLQRERTELHQKYAAILYLRCCELFSQYTAAVDPAIDFKGYNATVDEAMSALTRIPDKLLLEESGAAQPDLLSFFRDRQDAADFTGLWIHNISSNYTINVYAQNEQSISAEITCIKPTADGSDVSAIDITTVEDIPLYNGMGAKEYVDSFGNEGILYLKFSDGRLTATYEVLSPGIGGRWGIDRGAGSYHRQGETTPSYAGADSLPNGQYYARISDAVPADGGMALLHTVVLTHDSFWSEDIAGLSAGDSFSANGITCTVESGSVDEGMFCLGSEYLVRTMQGNWIVTYPSGVPVLYELGSYDFLIPAAMTMDINPIYAQSFSAEDTTAPVVDLFARYRDTLQIYRYLLTIEDNAVTKIELPYMP